MKTSSCKAKGRLFQQEIRDMYRSLGCTSGLVDGDIESRGMGQQGVDIIFSPKALTLFNHDIECKKHKRVAVPTQFKKHYEKYKSNTNLKLLFHENNHSMPLVTMKIEDFKSILAQLMSLREEVKLHKESLKGD